MALAVLLSLPGLAQNSSLVRDDDAVSTYRSREAQIIVTLGFQLGVKVASPAY
jgi:hypothetical protein